MGCQISYGFMLWKSMTALGSKRTPDANNVSFLGCGSKVKVSSFSKPRMWASSHCVKHFSLERAEKQGALLTKNID